jgi:hypothetical protein
MASADEVLFAPIDGSDEPWRVETRKLVTVMQQFAERQLPKRPKGALLLEEMMELAHLKGQKDFWFVEPGYGCNIYDDFNGLIYVSDEGDARLQDPEGDSVWEFNLYPHPTSKIFVFATEAEGQAYAELLADAESC